jgi:hypothetical protein
MLKRGGMIRSPRWACGSGRAWMTIKMAGLGRKTRSIEEQMAKLKEKVREKNISSSAWKRAACGGLGAGRGAVTVHLNVEVYSGVCLGAYWDSRNVTCDDVAMSQQAAWPHAASHYCMQAREPLHTCSQYLDTDCDPLRDRARPKRSSSGSCRSNRTGIPRRSPSAAAPRR